MELLVLTTNKTLIFYEQGSLSSCYEIRAGDTQASLDIPSRRLRLPVTDKNLMQLLKGYFNMFIDNRSSSKIKSKSLYMLRKRRSSKRIFVGRGELKHTNSKVIITFYVHNTEKLSLKREFIRLYKSLFF